eukprot:369893-Prymnesium_polylepis.2
MHTHNVFLPCVEVGTLDAGYWLAARRALCGAGRSIVAFGGHTAAQGAVTPKQAVARSVGVRQVRGGPRSAGTRARTEVRPRGSRVKGPDKAQSSGGPV